MPEEEEDESDESKSVDPGSVGAVSKAGPDSRVCQDVGRPEVPVPLEGCCCGAGGSVGFRRKGFVSMSFSFWEFGCRWGLSATILTIFLEGIMGPMSSVVLSTTSRAVGGRVSGTATCPEGFL